MTSFKLGMKWVVTFGFCTVLFANASASAQSMTNSNSRHEKFEEVFITAGYGTAFGAAVGAAMLSFYKNPSERLHYIPVGASIGFLAGSAVGSYFSFYPQASVDGETESVDLLAIMPSGSRVILSPSLDLQANQWTAFTAGFRVAEF